jgi:membrane protease YdiL (CAAX protease family)
MVYRDDAALGTAAPPAMTSRKDPIQVAIRVAVYIVLFIVSSMMFGWALASAGYLVGIIATSVLAAGFANWLSLRIFEGRHLVDAGLWWNSASSTNLGLGLAGGAGSAAAVLLPPLLFRGAHLLSDPVDRPTVGSILFLIVILAAGVLGEELLFRGYAFQVLLRAAGPYATVLPVGVLFALLHGSNPNATWFGLANTAAFGILFGYAYLRSRDLWLPIGLHLGWNVTLPLFGVNLSGLRMRMTGYEMSWTAGALWSGGEYGPEASLLTSAVVFALFFFLWKAPIRRQSSPIVDPPVENAVCESSPRLLS